MENTLVCKICEQPVLAEKFQRHSAKCKEVAEMKQKVMTIKSKLFVLIDKAYHLKAQLSTNAAIHL